MCAYSLRKLGKQDLEGLFVARGFLYSCKVVQVHNKNLKTHFLKLYKKSKISSGQVSINRT